MTDNIIKGIICIAVFTSSSPCSSQSLQLDLPLSSFAKIALVKVTKTSILAHLSSFEANFQKYFKQLTTSFLKLPLSLNLRIPYILEALLCYPHPLGRARNSFLQLSGALVADSSGLSPFPGIVLGKTNCLSQTNLSPSPGIVPYVSTG